MDWKEAATQDVDVNTYKIPEQWVYIHYYEAFNLLFRIENALRIFVYLVLKNQHKEKWTELQISNEEAKPETINSVARKRMAQSKSFGYIGHEITCPIMHLTSGELTNLICSDAYWKYFNSYFLGKKDIIKNKLEEIGTIRNSLAHFRPIKADDVAVLKQNSKQVLLGVEKFLYQALVQSNIVPTNTDEPWYKELKVIGSELCRIRIQQSEDENWISITIGFICPILEERVYTGSRNYTVLTIKSPAILERYKSLTNNISYLSEAIPFVSMPKDLKPKFVKFIRMTISRDNIKNNFESIRDDLKELLRTISEETELMQEDNLAKGIIVYSVRTYANEHERKEDKSLWSMNNDSLLCKNNNNNLPEYWGSLSFNQGEDFICATYLYPWMPESISHYEIPF
jgi:hypothetical protein